MADKDRRLRIFLGIPCYGEVGPEVLEDYMRFAYHLGRRMPTIDFFLGIRTKAEQFRARNQIVDGALQMACDYVLMLDDDMIINAEVTGGPSESYDFLTRLLAHDKDIIGVLYYHKGGTCAPVAMLEHGKGYRFLRDDEVTGGLQQVDVAGGGCLLVKMKVFDRLAHPYFGPEFEFGTDVQLCRAAKAKGMEVWIDSSIEFGHLKPERTIITRRNRHQFQLEDQVPGELKQTFVSASVYEDLLRDACAHTGYRDLDEITRHARTFLEERHAWMAAGGSDPDWYRLHGRERIARQVWFNTLNADKRRMTEFILNSVDHHSPKDILDFGCGIGIPAFVLAQKGHRVTAMDIQGTGTLGFLEWRAKHAGTPITIAESPGGVPALGGAVYDVIIAMDCLEHIADWAIVVREFSAHLKPGGVLFANNAILEDNLHPEHYHLENKAFLATCIGHDLLPFNQITYVKRAPVPVSQDQPSGPRELAHA